MFIPEHNSRKISKDDKVILSEDKRVKGGMFTKGHIFTVVDRLTGGKYLLKDEDGNIIKIESHMIKLISTLDESIKLTKNIENYNKKLRFIEDNCPYKDYDFDEYTKYWYCRLKGRNSNCKVDDKCEQHCDTVKLRELKIKEIKNDI